MKKSIVVLITGVLLVGIFSGCQKQEKAQGLSSKQESSSSVTASTSKSTSSQDETRDLKSYTLKQFPDAEIIVENNDTTVTVGYDGSNAKDLISNCWRMYTYWSYCEDPDGAKLTINIGDAGEITGNKDKNANAFGFQTDSAMITNQSAKDEYDTLFTLTDSDWQQNMDDLQQQQQDIKDEINSILDKHKN